MREPSDDRASDSDGCQLKPDQGRSRVSCRGRRGTKIRLTSVSVARDTVGDSSGEAIEVVI